MNRRKYLLLVTSLAEVKYPDPANSLYSVGDLREARVEASSNRAGYITAKMEDYDLIQVLVNGLGRIRDLADVDTDDRGTIVRDPLVLALVYGFKPNLEQDER